MLRRTNRMFNGGRAVETLSTHAYDRHTGFAQAMTAGLDGMDFTVDYLGRHTAQRLRMPGMGERTTRTTLSPNDRPLEQRDVHGVTRRFTYDLLGRLSKVTDEHVDVTLTYDALSRLSSRVAATEVASMVERRSYGADGRLCLQSWEHSTSGGTQRHAIALTWEADGKLIRRRYLDDADRCIRDEVMGYDARGRLVDHDVREARSGAWPRDEAGREYRRQIFVFDAIDNLTRVETTFVAGGSNVATLHYDAIDPDRLAYITETSGAGMSMSYDPNGAMIELHDRDGAHTIGFDAAARLTSVGHANGSSTRYRHGPGNRITGVIRDGQLANRIFEDGRLACIVSSSGETRRYVRIGATLVAETALSAGVRTWLVGGDMQGSIVVEGGTTRTYGAYGVGTVPSGGATTAFAGEVPEPVSNWYLLGQRAYVPAMRRFISPDPFSPFDRGGLNRYAYCGGDPIGRIDPSGNSWLNIGLAIFGIATAAVAAVISGGAALAAVAAAAGPLAGAVSTPSVIALSAAAAIDVVSLVAEGGSALATITGDDSLASVFGTIALATGVLGTAAGLASVAKATVRAGRRLANGRFGTRAPAIAARSEIDPAWLHRPLGGDDSVHVVRSPHIPSAKFDRRTRVGLKAEWRSGTRNGATHYAVDVQVTVSEIMDKVKEIALTLPPQREVTPFYVYGGAHGAADRSTWDANGVRLGADPQIRQAYDGLLDWPAHLLALKNYRLEYVHVPDLHVTTFEKHLTFPGIHFHGSCWSLADPRVLNASGMGPATVYSTHPVTSYP